MNGPAGAGLRAVRERIAGACVRAGRDPQTVRLVAVSKAVPAARVCELVDQGQRLFGENRVQEALPKIAASGPGVAWHLIGSLQRNKARHAVGVFELIHAVDGEPLAEELERRAAAAGVCQAILVQLNLSGEATKSGASAAELEPLVRRIAGLPHLDLRGLMTIPPPVERAEQSRRWFARLREIRDAAARSIGRPLPELSMGMSDDFETAIEEGATLVRIGRAIFGERA